MTADAEIIGLKTKGTPEIGVGAVRKCKSDDARHRRAPSLIEFAARMFRSGDFLSQLCAANVASLYSLGTERAISNE